MKFFSKIDPFIFLIAFAVGMFMCYITFPKPRIIIRHPTPENADNIVYNDEASNCYKYDAEEIKCPSDRGQISNHPLVIK